ncbi:DNA repair protein RecN [Pediococcus claussenii]|uniref:DNA repair protein RecN n=1 Tax=Pediococcus claussenii (strain ATCC BAA-344 / DSM 14800 / JCM 18046 / KCTC 3811 / LMG 21948 / P06) TaxID=701521 RepID=G8PDJ0_PEDCP|nr:DNA repair protein RecN [Pediococcus claussenii]AEV95325.1 DNA repair protein RecN [Pediococcus claussenii ATCC BAA-344]ANZ68858.1 DNA repair protein RecN [Pediococcus claussenii]ANZ70674.1 DNA repair protein RecN [Pediococcus claussenii]KRN19493.1 recN protein [Pediococcus claussenii]
MLREISIKDFAIIEKLDVDFSKGMTALTGETGAGKSIIIDAVGLLAGGRGSSDFIRTGATKAVLQGVFDANTSKNTEKALDEVGVEPDDELIITREIHNNGRNVCRINGTIVNLQSLRLIGDTLIDIHGQNEHQELMDREKHLDTLDQYDDGQIKTVLKEYQTIFSRLQTVKQSLKKQLANEQEWNQRVDMLRFQIDEISTANLKSGEEEELILKRDQLNNFQAISAALSSSMQALENDDGGAATDLVGGIMNDLESIAEYGTEYQKMAEEASNAYYSLEDVASSVRDAIDGLEWNNGELDQVEQRLELIHQLKRKYGDSINEVLEYFEKIKTELDSMIGTGDSANELSQQVEELEAKTQKLGIRLSKIRKKSALSLEKRVQEQLNELYMNNTIFKVQFTERKSPELSGLDDVEFFIQPNPGEQLRPLVKIASGGELSRIMLALKTIFAQNDGVTSIIFDEVDTGVSGRVAQAIADKIHEIANHSQVLCITHLPQVAAKADQQLHVAKEVKNDRTTTTLTVLNDEGRVQEIARMLAGNEITKLSVAHARELLTIEHS